MNSANAQAMLTSFIPLAVIALLFWVLAKWSAPAWALLIAVLLGVVLSGTIAGPPIHQILSQFSGGRLH
jgi:mannose/fructose/N-acetylgalactosamine-specific phosphotransferase system component IID